jgi:ABC-type molybdenum transport system ATPase subunit/photorepair protein PhrA
MEHDIIVEISRLLEKTGLEGLVLPPSNNDQILESALIDLRNLNARYDKEEALNQVQWLMENYNIQIDELIERIGS